MKTPNRTVATCFLILSTFCLSCLAAPKKMLVITESRGFTHDVVKRGTDGLCLVEKTLESIGNHSGVFTTVHSQNAIDALTKQNLDQFDAIFFYTTGTLIPDGEPREALLQFVKSGKAFIGAHSATDTFADFPGYYQLINGTFNGHPWGAGTTSTFANHEPTHPVVSMFPASFRYKDEIYQYRNYDPASVRVLLSLDMTGSDPKRPYHVPVAWVRTYGTGRLFYTNLGHNPSTWEDTRYQEHLLAGIRWAMKLIDGPAEPNPDAQALEHAKSFLAVHAQAAGADWAALYERVSAKSRSDRSFLGNLRRQIQACNSLPAPDAQKNSPEEVQSMKEKHLAMVRSIIASIE